MARSELDLAGVLPYETSVYLIAETKDGEDDDAVVRPGSPVSLESESLGGV